MANILKSGIKTGTPHRRKPHATARAPVFQKFSPYIPPGSRLHAGCAQARRGAMKNSLRDKNEEDARFPACRPSPLDLWLRRRREFQIPPVLF
jgi:hypothetical protein